MTDEQPIPQSEYEMILYRMVNYGIEIVSYEEARQVLQAYMMLQQSIPLPDQIQEYVDLIEDLFEKTYRTLVTAHSPLEFVFVVITVALVPALAEETLFRGVVQRSIGEATGGQETGKA